MPQFNDDQFYQYPPFNPVHTMPHWRMDSDFEIPVVSSVGNGPAGPKGDPLVFDDLTDEQLAEIYEQASFVTTQMLEGYYVTEGNNTVEIEIPIEGYEEFDILMVDVEGLDLIEGKDYTVGTDSIILREPITHSGTEVHFRALRYELADGDKTIVHIEGAKTLVFDTVADMKACDELEAGSLCRTMGFHTIGDGGGAWYQISTFGPANEMDVIRCGHKFAKLITGPIVTPEMFGALGDSSQSLIVKSDGIDTNNKPIENLQIQSFATADRPDASQFSKGHMIYDSTLGIPLWSWDDQWRDASGTAR